MFKWNMIVDVAECNNCQLCTLATMDEYLDNHWPGYSAPMPRHGHRWIDIVQKERGTLPYIDVVYVPTMCNHCDNAPCVAAAENDAVVKRDDGIVVIDPDRAKGQRQIVDACPYGHIWWNSDLELPQSWNFDAHLIDAGWEKTRASQACPTGALLAVFVSDEEMNRLVAEQKLEALNPEFETQPRVWYRNLHRFTKCFVAGSVTTRSDGVIDCLEGASVTLFRGRETVAETLTDGFGHFRFDRLEPNSGYYRLVIEHSDSDSKTIKLTLGESVCLDTICL